MDINTQLEMYNDKLKQLVVPVAIPDPIKHKKLTDSSVYRACCYRDIVLGLPLERNKVEILGSYALHCIYSTTPLNEYAPKYYVPHDIDVYIRTSSEESFRNICLECIPDIVRVMLYHSTNRVSYVKFSIGRDASLMTITCGGNAEFKVQLIYLNDRINHKQLGYSFDLTCCSLRLYKIGVNLFLEYPNMFIKEYTQNGLACFTEEIPNSVLHKRILKYLNRGFRIALTRDKHVRAHITYQYADRMMYDSARPLMTFNIYTHNDSRLNIFLNILRNENLFRRFGICSMHKPMKHVEKQIMAVVLLKQFIRKWKYWIFPYHDVISGEEQRLYEPAIGKRYKVAEEEYVKQIKIIHKVEIDQKCI